MTDCEHCGLPLGPDSAPCARAECVDARLGIAETPRKSVCRGCGKNIVWAVTADGKRLPLDPVPAVYSTTTKNGVTTAARERRSMVLHHVTCPNVSQFSGKNRAKETA